MPVSLQCSKNNSAMMKVTLALMFLYLVCFVDCDDMPSRDARSPDAEAQFGLHSSYGAPVHHAPVHHAPVHHAPAPYTPPVHHAPAPYAPPVHHAPVHKEPPRPYQYEYGVADQYSGAQFNEVQSQDAAGVVVGMYNMDKTQTKYLMIF